MSSQQRTLVAGGVALTLLVAAIVFFTREDGVKASGAPVIVCIDSTTSTEEIRDSYLDDIETVVEEAADRRAGFYASACGANAIGSVDWPVHEDFDTESLSGALDDEARQNLQAKAIEGVEGEIAKTSPKGGTPLAEILEVATRQCEQAGGGCPIYVFTDGEWADDVLHVPREPISDAQEAEYVSTYGDQIGDLTGAVVNFVGVGFGTEIGFRLLEAREVADALIEAAGGRRGTWAVSL